MRVKYKQWFNTQLWLLTVFHAWVDPWSYHYIIPRQTSIVICRDRRYEWDSGIKTKIKWHGFFLRQFILEAIQKIRTPVIDFSTYCSNSFKHLSYLQKVSECFLQKMMLAAVRATDVQLIAPPYLLRISAHQTFRIWTICCKCKIHMYVDEIMATPYPQTSPKSVICLNVQNHSAAAEPNLDATVIMMQWYGRRLNERKISDWWCRRTRIPDSWNHSILTGGRFLSIRPEGKHHSSFNHTHARGQLTGLPINHQQSFIGLNQSNFLDIN